MKAERECVQCHALFQAKTKISKFCSEPCKSKWRYENPSNPKCICKMCKTEFIPKVSNRTTYCSRECAFEDKRAKPKEPKAKNVHANQCTVCERVFVSGKKLKRCSDDCHKERARISGRERYHIKSAAAVVNEVVSKECKQCGVSFNTNFMSTQRMYCSYSCSRRANKSRRQNRKRGQFVANVYRADIIKRDDGTCQLCGKKVNLKLKVPHPMSATMDHIIPLAKDGTHEPKNVQLAHFICNSIKSDRGGGQLLMF